MGTVTFPGIETTLIEAVSGSITINETTFPETDSTPRATATFGSTDSFLSRSTRQEVTTSSATILAGITIVGVNFNGPVTLTFADNEVNLSDIYIVDEGGFCNPINTITATSTSASGELVLSNAYNYMKARTNGSGSWFSEVATTIIAPENPTENVNSDGSTTVTSTDGTSVTTSSDGNTTFTINPDGSTVESIVSGNTTTSITVSVDGTIKEAIASNNGNSSSTTTYPDGSVEDVVNSNNGNYSSFFTDAEGNTTDVQESNNGNSTSTYTGIDGTVESQATFSSGKIENSTINPDGSSYSFLRTTSGKVTIINIDSSGDSVMEYYIPWKSFYTVTTTISGSSSSQTFSPNPYAT